MQDTDRQKMRMGAFHTHQQRKTRSEAAIIRSVERLKESGKNPTKAAVARLCNLSRQHVTEHYSHLFRKPFSFIDLFAGIGGMRLGFEKSGGRCVFTSEYDIYPAMMYEDNFKSEVQGDITKIVASEIPGHDILVAGFPCQPFSIAGVSKKNSLGRAHGFSCQIQGTLFFDVARIIEHHQPKMFLLENVKNLKSHDKGRTFKVIIETLENLGYMVSVKIINANLRVPQKRERIYIVGVRVKNFSTSFNFPDIKPNYRVLADILLPDPDDKYTMSDKLWNSLKAHAEKHRKKGNGFGYGLCTGESIARTLSARYYKDGSEILIDQPGKNPRRLTPRECGLLMGFPKDFKIPLSDTRAYKCFGNSVVVPVIQEISGAMCKHLETEIKEKPVIIPEALRYDEEYTHAMF